MKRLTALLRPGPVAAGDPGRLTRVSPPLGTARDPAESGGCGDGPWQGWRARRRRWFRRGGLPDQNERIAFESDHGWSFDVWSVAADGSDPLQLTDDAAVDGRRASCPA